jgi:DNA-binding transcriptional MerR regulator
MTGVRPSAIRYYEACRLMPMPARRSGKRVYDREGARHVTMILAARRLGFSIREIKDLARMDIGARQEVAKARAVSLRKLIAELGATASRLDTLSNCDCGSGSACHL